MIVLHERNEGDVRRFEESLRVAKSAIREACEIFEDMKEQFSERGGSYGERYSQRGDYGERHYGGGYYGREWEEMPERRYHRQ